MSKRAPKPDWFDLPPRDERACGRCGRTTDLLYDFCQNAYRGAPFACCKRCFNESDLLNWGEVLAEGGRPVVGCMACNTALVDENGEQVETLLLGPVQ